MFIGDAFNCVAVPDTLGGVLIRDALRFAGELDLFMVLLLRPAFSEHLAAHLIEVAVQLRRVHILIRAAEFLVQRSIFDINAYRIGVLGKLGIPAPRDAPLARAWRIIQGLVGAALFPCFVDFTQGVSRSVLTGVGKLLLHSGYGFGSLIAIAFAVVAYDAKSIFKTLGARILFVLF